MPELSTILNGHPHQEPAAARPSVLIATRHGESTANVEFQLAEANGALAVPITCRDADIPLSSHGQSQAQALGRWWAELPGPDRPRSVWCSPYVRTTETARIAIAQAAGLGALPAGLPVRYDERLRDRELGVLEMLTAAAIDKRHPERRPMRRKMGELYYRPPGGELGGRRAAGPRLPARRVCRARGLTGAAGGPRQRGADAALRAGAAHRAGAAGPGAGAQLLGEPLAFGLRRAASRAVERGRAPGGRGGRTQLTVHQLSCCGA